MSDEGEEVAPSVAGASARAEGLRRQAAEAERRRQRRERRPVFGRLANALEGPPTAGQSYLRGAVGEEKLGAALDALVGQGLRVLHDRRRPRTAANIDHLVVAPTGVWVIDAKRYTGKVTTVDRGGWFRSDVRLVVGGRERTKLVDGVQKQVADVQLVLERSSLPGLPVHGALCFVDADFGLFAKPLAVGGVLVTWRKALRSRLLATGPVDAEQRAAAVRHLAEALPPAGRRS